MSHAFSWKTIWICSLGSILEWYDFTLFGLLAPILATLFFPMSGHKNNLLLVFATFASGYIMRPLGALFFGKLADQRGRKAALAITIIAMALSTTLIGCAPTFTSVGLLAPCLIVFLRLLQGFSASGEYPSAAALLFESAPTDKKSLFCSFSITGLFGGILCASMVIAFFTHIFSHAAMLAWGWRIPFLFGTPLGALGFYLRFRLQESKPFQALQRENKISPSPIIELKYHYKTLLKLLGLYWLPNSVFYIVFIYSIAQLAALQILPLSQLSLFNTISMIFLVLLLPVFGYFTDKFGRKIWILIATFFVLFFTHILFKMVFSGNAQDFFIALMIYAIFTAMLCSPMIVFAAELFPTQVRVSAIALTNNISGALFGGTAPLVATFLTHHTGSLIASSYYIIFCAVLGLIILALRF